METLPNPSPAFRLLIWTALFLPFLVQAQGESSRIRFTTLSKSTPGGLKSDLVRDVTQDLGGYVWLATDRGLVRFDGWETIHYHHDPGSPSSLSSDQVTCLATTRKEKGPLWIGTSSSGLMKFDEKTGEAVRFLKGTQRGAKLLSDHILDLAISDDRFLWIGTEAGLNVLDLATDNIALAEAPLDGQAIASVTALGDGTVWVGTAAGELHQWNTKDQSFSKIWSVSVPVTAVAADPGNRLWIGTGGKGLYSFAADSSDEPVPAELEAKNITSLHVDSNGDLWIGSNSGLFKRDRENDGFLHFTNNPRHADSLTDDHVSAIFEDRSRMLWIATYGGGTSRFSLERNWFSHIRHTQEKEGGLPHSFVRSIAASHDGTIWLGTAGGLALWNTDKDSFVPPPFRGPESGEGVNHLLVDHDESLWIGTRGAGLIRRMKDGTVSTWRHDPSDPSSLGHDNVSAIYQDRAGRIFVGTQGGGLHRYDHAFGNFVHLTTESAKSVDFVTGIAEDSQGNLWVPAQSGTHLIPAGSDVLREFASVFPEAERPTSTRATSVLPDSNGIVWIGTLDAGLDRFNTATGEITNFNSAVHGLPDDMVVSLIKDGNNFLWVATRNGISRLNAMQNEFRVFTVEDGLQKDGFHLGSVARDMRGRLFFGGQDGFNIVDPAKLPAMPRTPNPILTSFEYFGEQVVPKEGGILEREVAATDEIRIPFDERLRFAFRFANLDYRFPNRGHFRYMLKGYEHDWVLAGDDRKAAYTGLSPGKYQFLVQSSLDGRDWPDVTAKVRVVVTPPWWQTWWFRTLGLSLLVLGTVGLTKFSIQSRVRQMRRHEEMLTAQRDKAEAALARQLQNRLLIQRSTRERAPEGEDEQNLSEALQQITEEFEATQCLVERLVETDGENGSAVRRLEPIGYWNARPDTASGRRPVLDLEDPLTRQVLESPSVVMVANPGNIPDSIRSCFAPEEPITLLAARTSFLDRANGIVLLLRVGTASAWDEDDFKLLEALTGQFGISIAQINTAEIEEKYRRHLEETRHQAEVANRAKSDFLAKMTHELRTPLNAIIGFSEILSGDNTLNPRQRETLGIINNSGEHLLDVINEILDLSKIEAGKMELHDESFELAPLLKSVYEMLSIKAREKRIAFHFAARTALPGEVVTDRSKLRQILINLVGNAIKFTAQGGVGVSVASEVVSPPETVDGRARRRVRVHFEIRDTGRGIREDEIGKLFERYSQTESGRRSSEGTGLGLPIARSFVQMMGGDIVVESVFGEGTIFRFAIECDELAPVEAEAAAALGTALDERTAQRINGHTSPLEEVRILIAEDQSTNRLLLKRILGKAGFALAEVENGQDAVAKWSEWKPHLIFMDEDMPLMKGSEAAREIRSLAREENPVIVSLTAYALEQARIAALEAGCTDFVAKPFRAHELFSVISRHLPVDYTFTEAA